MAARPAAVTKRSCSRSLHDEEEGDLDDVINELRRGPWTLEEDNLLIHCIACHGEGRWNLLAKCSGLKRTGKSCRLRWLNYLKPDVKRGNLTIEEQILIIQLHSKLGNRWSRIAKYLPGRTDNEIKNYWRTRVQKRARQHLKIDIVNSAMFRDDIGCFSIPRVIQNIEELAQISPPVPPPPPPPPAAAATTTIEDSLIRAFAGIQNFSNEHQQVPLMNNNSSNMSISSTIPEISGYPTSPDQAFAGNITTTTTVDNNSFLTEPAGCYYYVMNNNIHDTDAFTNLVAAGSPTSAPGSLLENSLCVRHMAENNWVMDNEVANDGSLGITWMHI